MERHLIFERSTKTALIGIAATIINSVMLLSEGVAAEPSVTIQMYCDRPDVPGQVVSSKLPVMVFVLQRALRIGDCRYSSESVDFVPLRLVKRVAAHPDAAEPVGYIWSFRLKDGTVKYWVFWRSEHEALRKRATGI